MPRSQFRTILLGGVLPVVLYTIVEETFGIFWGLVAGMASSVIEVIWEWRSQGKVDPITWGGSIAMLALGGISLATQSGVWFRLQPAFLEALMAGVLLGSAALGKPFLTAMARKQGVLAQVPPEALPFFERRMRGLNVRVGFFFLIHTGLAVWAALAWSTRAWAALKGIGFTGSFFAYLGLEVLWMRRRPRKETP